MQIFEIISKDKLSELVSFNFDFLEANVLNILLLLSGLIYILKKFLGSILLDRKNKVLFAIQESEERLEQANIRLKEAEKQLTQTQMIVNQINEEAELTAKRVRQSILEQGKSDIEKLRASSKISIQSAENQVSLQIQQKITALAVKKVRSILKSHMTPKVQTQIIDSNIMQLEGEIYI